MNVSRFINIKNELIKCEVQFVTPAFLGGANQSAELRTPPFKAALRWWWRVLFGAQYNNEIYKEESKRFGSTDNASKVRIEIVGNFDSAKTEYFKGRDIFVTSRSRNNGQPFKINLIDYLAFGLCDRKNYTRNYFSPNSIFDMNISIHKSYKQELLLCLHALFIFGGIGSRSRNGFGSICLVSAIEKSCYDLKWQLEKPQNYPTLNCFSKLYETGKRNSWNEALSDIAEAYRKARLSLENRHSFDKRALLSLPIIAQGISNNNRSPKQFMMHVAKTANNQFIGRILSLPIIHEQQKEYNDMVQNMHLGFAKAGLIDKTDDISKLLGVEK
ncbi:MAG: type III-B CRISPR module RAMP protein Cmr1 [Campylobacteraceae bacterium]|jgi:CRISPR-associated protein Cmr1|nr:type III-B CRISPR module RAMP protein Cmr1 [Campylobacteraceae bacterium]